MPTAAALIKRLDKTLKRVAPPERTVFKRIVTHTGGDSLIGRPGTVTNVDTELDPQPYLQRHSNVGAGVDEPLLTSGSVRIGENYLLLMSPTALSASDLQNKDLLIVLKDSVGNEEVYRVTDFEPVGLSGSDVMYTVSLRSTKR